MSLTRPINHACRSVTYLLERPTLFVKLLVLLVRSKLTVILMKIKQIKARPFLPNLSDIQHWSTTSVHITSSIVCQSIIDWRENTLYKPLPNKTNGLVHLNSPSS